MRAALIVNPIASRVTPALVAAVERELGDVETMLTERRGHAVELAEEACRSFERVYVLSGDGGYNEAVNGANGAVPFAFLPGGETSVLPRALGLPRDPVECARVLARSERVRPISLGRMNGRRFTFSAGIGLDAELVRAVDRFVRRKGRRPGDAVFVWSLVQIVAARRGRFDEALTVDGHGRAAFALVANCGPYSYVGRLPLHVAPEARFELGLDLVAPRRLRLRRLPTLAWWVLLRPGQARAPDVLHLHDLDGIRIECDRPTAIQLDGEDLGDISEAVFEVEREALDVVVAGLD
jgi:diacylglycerol kinase family enzyme